MHGNSALDNIILFTIYEKSSKLTHKYLLNINVNSEPGQINKRIKYLYLYYI